MPTPEPKPNRNVPWSIYVLRDPESRRVRYVGWTRRGLTRRLGDHIRESRSGKNHKCRWVRSLTGTPLIEEVQIGFGDPAPDEIEWIAMAVDAGCRLVNSTIGGDRLVDPSPEVR